MGDNFLKVAQCHTEPYTDPLQSIFAKSAHLNVCIDERLWGAKFKRQPAVGCCVAGGGAVSAIGV